MADTGCFVEKPGKLKDASISKDAMLVEIAAGEGQETRRRVLPRPETHFAPHAIAQIDLGVGRLISLPKGLCRPPHFLQSQKGLLDVFAGAEVVYVVIRTGTVVVARSLSAHGNTVGLCGVRVCDKELGEDGVVADVLYVVALNLSVLFPQDSLPLVEGQVIRLVRP